MALNIHLRPVQLAGGQRFVLIQLVGQIAAVPITPVDVGRHVWECHQPSSHHELVRLLEAGEISRMQQLDHHFQR